MQVNETLIYNGEKVEHSFDDWELPEDDLRIIKLNDREVRPDITQSTACWRGYIGTWEIIGDKLYLIALRGKYKMLSSVPIIANWYTGTITIPTGKEIDTKTYSSAYEKEIHIKVDKGIVIETTLVDNLRIQRKKGVRWNY